ncbi:hypothetical protein [Methylobacterium sp. P5_C11]
MVEEAPIVSELRRALEASDQESVAAADAVLPDLAAESHPPAEGFTLDHVETSRTRARADEASTADGATGASNLVRIANFRAHSVKG